MFIHVIMLLFNKWNQARFLFINLRYLNTQTTRKKRKVWTVEESQRLLELVNVHGQSFRFLESYFPGRTEISLSAKYRYLLQSKGKKKEREALLIYV